MALRPVLEYPDPRLRTRAEPVRHFDAELACLIDDLFETLYASRAIGLAATQVDVHRQVLAIDLSARGEAPEVFINPRILSRRRIGIVEESCVSLPGISECVRRATVLRVHYQDRHGQAVEREVNGLLAVCLGHEIDHLEGRLFIDRLSLLKRLRLRWRFSRKRPAQRPALNVRTDAAGHA
jgi:peptide deformylase